MTETTVTAEALQRRTDIDIDPPDADKAAEGHQVALEDLTEITVTVTSADGSRKKTYRVRLSPEEAAGPAPEEAAEPAPDCLRGAVAVGFSLLVYAGGSVEELVACAQSRSVTALYVPHEGEYVPYILGAPAFVNEEFVALYPDGLLSLTPLIAKSEGPPSPAPASEDVPEFGPDCLRGEIASGFSLVLHEGGSVEDLDSCAQDSNVSALYALVDGEYVPYILGAPVLVNEAFVGLFPEGLAPVTPLVAKSDELPATTDNDVPEVTVSFELDTYTVGEGSSVTVKVTLSADPGRTVVIPISTLDQGGASSTDDYSVPPASLTFNSGDTEKSFTFTDDDVDDDGESVLLRFGLLPTGIVAGTNSQAIVSITDGDVPVVTVSFEQSSYTVAESDDPDTPGVEESKVTVQVSLSADPERTVTIPLTETLMNEISDGDYDGVPTDVEFAAGQTEATFTVTASMDEEDDGGERIEIGFGELPVGVTAADPSTTSVAIVDGNVPDATVKGESVTVTVTLGARPCTSILELNQQGLYRQEANAPSNYSESTCAGFVPLL